MKNQEINFSEHIIQHHDLQVVKAIGQGNWSVVYEAYNLAKTLKYAVKVIS
jgi:serine/threonine protein kinase